jgi:ankyrin repeat protein
MPYNIENYIDKNKNIDKNILLQLAIDDQDIDLIKELFQYGKPYFDLDQALIKAAKIGSEAILNLIWHRVTNLVQYTFDHDVICFALDYVCKNDNLPVFKNIYDYFQFNMEEDYHYFCVVFGAACEYNAKNIIEYSLENRLYAYQSGISAAIRTNNIDLMKYLIDKNNNDEEEWEDLNEENFLFDACTSNNRNILIYLLNNNIIFNINRKYLTKKDIIFIMDCLYEITTLKRHSEILNDHKMCNIIEKVTNRDVANNVLKYLISI